MKKLVNGRLVALTAAEEEAARESRANAAEEEAAREANRLPRVEFLSRFTPEQRAAIYGARVDDPVIDDLVMKLSTYEVLEKDDPLLTQGLDYLVQQGFITEADRTVLLG